VEVTEEEDANGNPYFVTTVLTSEISISFGTSAGAPAGQVKGYSVRLLDNSGNPLGGHASMLSSDSEAVQLPPGYECIEGATGDNPYGCSLEFQRAAWQPAAEPLILTPITMVGAFDMLERDLNKAAARFVFTIESAGRTYDIVRNVSVTYLGDCVTDCRSGL
jgi:hypothetical protein